MSHRVWIRLDLPDHELSSLQVSIPECEYVQGMNVESDERQLANIDVVFTEAPLLENLTTRMPSLKWLHVTRGGVSAYLTPDVKARPIDVTGSKGIHGVVFSEFALACIFALAKKLPDCLVAQKQKKWEKLQPMEVEGTTLGIVGLGTAGAQFGAQSQSLGHARRRHQTHRDQPTRLRRRVWPTGFSANAFVRIGFRGAVTGLRTFDLQYHRRAGTALDEA